MTGKIDHSSRFDFNEEIFTSVEVIVFLMIQFYNMYVKYKILVSSDVYII